MILGIPIGDQKSTVAATPAHTTGTTGLRNTQTITKKSDGFSISRGTYNQDYEYSRINRFGSAVGAKNSTINLGNGDNEASISANGGESAQALSNSSLETGKGDDEILLALLHLAKIAQSIKINTSINTAMNTTITANIHHRMKAYTKHAMAGAGGAQLKKIDI